MPYLSERTPTMARLFEPNKILKDLEHTFCYLVIGPTSSWRQTTDHVQPGRPKSSLLQGQNLHFLANLLVIAATWVVILFSAVVVNSVCTVSIKKPPNDNRSKAS